MRSLWLLGLVTAVAASVAAGVATGDPAAGGSSQRAAGGRLTVFAAASLTDALPAIDAHPRYAFAGSDVLALQIRQGAPADVFAAASPKYAQQLYRAGLVRKPIPFATNTLVAIVPGSNPAGIHSVGDLAKPGVKIVVADPSVPVGAYTRTVLGRLGISAAVLKNVVSEETDVRSVLAKVALGEADAGFVYRTDAKTARGKVKTLAVRASAQPRVVYEVAVVKGSPHLRAAVGYVARLLRPAAQHTLARFGFGPRPKPSR
jgi:molybdate transport system substrate-binding protein